MNEPPLVPNRRILVVDDNSSIHADFREILCGDKPAGEAVDKMEAVLFGDEPPVVTAETFDLDFAFQGEEALQKVQDSLAERRPYAMAFIDVRMPPGWDGIETVSRIWKVYPGLQVVICTAYADYSWEEMRARVGQPDGLVILKKPFDNIEVQQLAHALTAKWSLNQRAEMHLAQLDRVNASLALSEERFSKAFKESPFPTAIQSFPERRLLDVNERFVQITARSREELLNRTPTELCLWENLAAADQWYEALKRGELVREQPARIRVREGTLRELLVSLSLVDVSGTPHVLLLAQDISERALLERQLRQAQKMEAIGQLAAGVAHDFNNILTVIQGHAGLLQRRLSPESPESKSLAQISEAGVRAATLVRQLLMFSRKQVMQMRRLDVNELLRNAIKMLSRLVGEQVSISFVPQEGLPAVSADPSMVEQIAMNLAVNARDAMPNGGQLTINTCLKELNRAATPMDPQERKGEFICVTFQDTGTGMDTQTLTRIFEPFFTTKPVGKGTGLGLSTVLGIVRQHQGWIEVDSSPKRGSAFRVYFPATRLPAEKTEPVVETKLRRGRETILVAEDEDALREMVVSVLKMQGYTVLEAASGVQALEVWDRTSRTIDLLVTDMVMPGGILGPELAERLVAKSPGLRVIYTSGYSPGMAGKDASLLARRNFLPKPYSIGKLAQTVRDCLDAGWSVERRQDAAQGATVSR